MKCLRIPCKRFPKSGFQVPSEHDYKCFHAIIRSIWLGSLRVVQHLWEGSNVGDLHVHRMARSRLGDALPGDCEGALESRHGQVLGWWHELDGAVALMSNCRMLSVVCRCMGRHGMGWDTCRYDVDLKKHELYVVEPSGVMYRYFGAAVGKGRQVCR